MKSGAWQLKLIRHRRQYLRSFFNPLLKYKSLLLNDKWVIESVFPRKRNGFFVEAGSFDGVFNSSCYALEKRFGWSGICIEPHSELHSACVNNRPRSTVVKVALSDRIGTETFVEATAKGYSGIKKELLRIEKIARNEGWVKDQWRTSGSWLERRVDIMPLHELLKKYDAPSKIDYIAMDIEGSEAAAFAGFPFSQYQIGCLSIEGPHCDELLTSHGFVRVSNRFNRTGSWEHYFVHEDFTTGFAEEEFQ